MRNTFVASRSSVVACCILMFALPTTALAGAAAITVTNNGDSGAGTLRQAIADLLPGGTISFDPSLAGQTITLTSGQLLINKSLTINGLTTSPGVFVSGNNAVRVFYVSAGTVIINNLTVQNGRNVPTIPSNIGGAGLFTDTGAAVTLNNCAVLNNATNAAPTVGGGVVVNTGASLTMNNCTVSGNSASFDGGGILNLGTFNVNNCTIVNNTTPGGGGGLETAAGTTTLRNTIIAGNTGSSGPDGYTPGGTTQSADYNLIGSTSNFTISAAPNDVTGFSYASLLLGPLQNNGGPTSTYALLPGSPAINAIPGGNGAPATDQRGIIRPQGAAWDVGAYEVAQLTVTYNANGATGGTAPSNQTKIPGVNLTLAIDTGSLVKAGYTLTGWNTAADGSGTHYALGGTYTNDAAVTLYAEWTINTYTVSYNANGATGGTPPGDQTKTYGVSLTLANNTGSLVKTGYTLNGWNSAADGSGTHYALGGTYTNDAAVALYAEWTGTVTYNGNGNTGGTAPTDATNYLPGATVTTAANSGALVKTGFDFNGWNTAADGSGPTYAPAATFAMAGNITLYAKWTASAPTVTGVLPSSGPAIGGTSVTIVGTNFAAATSVKFGSGNAPSFTIDSDSQITAVSPPGSSGTVDVTVTTPAGTSAISAADRFTYIQQAWASGSPLSGTVPLTVAFSGGPSGLSYSWNFADGTGVSAEQNPTHTFVAAGTYDVTLTVSDGLAAATATVTVVVNAAGGVLPGDTDSDGDGFSDQIELALGSNPDNTNDTPFGLTTPAQVHKLDVTSLILKLDSAKSGNDKIALTGSLPLLDNLQVVDRKIVVNVGGVVKAFTLDAKQAHLLQAPLGGRAIKLRSIDAGGTKCTASLLLTFATQRGRIPAQQAGLGVKLTKGDFAKALAAAGLSAGAPIGTQATVPVTAIFNGVSFQKAVSVENAGNRWQSPRK